MRILSARIFSKSLAGKLKNFQQRLLITETIFQKKMAHAYFKRPYFFLSLLAGKLKNFQQRLLITETIFQKKNGAYVF